MIGLDHDPEAAFAFEHVAHAVADGDRLGDLVDVGDGQAVARELVAIRFNLQVAQACHLLDSYVVSAGNALQRAGNAVADAAELVEIGSVDHGRYVRPHTGD